MLLQFIYGWIFTVDVVSDFRFGHGAAHRRSRPGYGVAAQIDGGFAACCVIFRFVHFSPRLLIASLPCFRGRYPSKSTKASFEMASLAAFRRIVSPSRWSKPSSSNLLTRTVKSAA